MSATNECTVATKITVWLLGGWLFLTVAMSYVAGGNFVHTRPGNLRDAEKVFADIPAEGERRLRALRYVASELNRAYFALYATVQVGVGALGVVFLLLSRRGGRVGLSVLALCFLSTVYFKWSLVPEIVELGRTIDFDRDPAKVASFDRLHHVAVGVEGAKMVLLLGLAAALFRTRRDGSPRADPAVSG